MNEDPIAEAPKKPWKKWFSRRTTRMWKNGGEVEAACRPSDVFLRSEFEAGVPFDADRIFAWDTESTHVGAERVLTTDLLPIAFRHEDVLIDLRDRPGQSLVARMLEQISDRFSGPMGRPSLNAQRKKRTKRKTGGRDGRRQKIPTAVAVGFNVPYDVCRCFSDLVQLRQIHAGVDSYRMRIDERWEIEWERYIDKSAPQFRWIVRDLQGRRITRVVGMDLTGYWKTSLEKALKAVGLPGKKPIEELVPGIHERSFETFNAEEIDHRREYATVDARRTLELHNETVGLLTRIDPRVIRANGLPPCSAPGGAGRMMFAHAFDLHPELDEWRAPPPFADQDGADAYFGGRAACPHPGVFARISTLDLKSAYPTAMAMLPDPVTARYERVEPTDHFDLARWRGKWGVLRISGEALDPVYPAHRIHDGSRLRYVYGPVERQAVTIPEIVIGVVRGALRVDRIHAGTVVEGSPERSFMRGFVTKVFRLKEEHGKDPVGTLAKLMLNSPYGKLIEIQCTELVCERAAFVPDVRAHRRFRPIAKSMIRCVLATDPDDVRVDEVYLGETSIDGAPQLAALRREFLIAKGALDACSPEETGLRLLETYCQTIRPLLAEDLPLLPLREVVRAARSYRTGRYFMPIFASQITGLVSAQLGLMMWCTKALCADTDAAHFHTPEGDPLQMPGVGHYFRLMKEAGYQAPRLADRDSLIEGTTLGTWTSEMPAPSIESIFVRPKRYSHLYADPKKGFSYKQATHGMTRFADPEAGRGPDQVHEAMREMLGRETVTYMTRRAPRKGREAVRTGAVAGEFVSHRVTVENGPVRGTRLGPDGIVRWMTREEIAMQDREEMAEAAE